MMAALPSMLPMARPTRAFMSDHWSAICAAACPKRRNARASPPSTSVNAAVATLVSRMSMPSERNRDATPPSGPSIVAVACPSLRSLSLASAVAPAMPLVACSALLAAPDTRSRSRAAACAPSALIEMPRAAMSAIIRILRHIFFRLQPTHHGRNSCTRRRRW